MSSHVNKATSHITRKHSSEYLIYWLKRSYICAMNSYVIKTGVYQESKYQSGSGHFKIGQIKVKRAQNLGQKAHHNVSDMSDVQKLSLIS